MKYVIEDRIPYDGTRQFDNANPLVAANIIVFDEAALPAVDTNVTKSDRAPLNSGPIVEHHTTPVDQYSHVFNCPKITPQYCIPFEPGDNAVHDGGGVGGVGDVGDADAGLRLPKAVKPKAVEVDRDVMGLDLDAIGVRRRIQVAGQNVAAGLRKRDREAGRIPRGDTSRDGLVLIDFDLRLHRD